MKFKLTLFALSLLISGCQSIGLQTSETNPFSISDEPDVELEDSKSTPQEPAYMAELCVAESDSIDTQAYLDTWERIQSQLSFDIPDNRRVRAQKSWYAGHPQYMKRVSERAGPYLFHIVEELEKNQLPLELALLPIVESAFDPFAYSHGRASGMWQFIPDTGKNFGLNQNWWFDGRRDVYLSTQAAVKFLAYLNKRFDGDWLLALAAYNSGEGNVSRAIRQNKRKGKPTDFWSLDLPRETQAYVPKLLALSQILLEQQFDQSEQLWMPIENLPVFDRVATDSQIDLSLAASLAEIDMADFYQLNPAFNQWATAPKGPHHILLPIEKIALFKQNLAKIPKDQRISFKTYQIQKGDNLISIARKFGTTVDLLKDNNEIRNSSIRTGKSLLIPVASKARDEYHKSSQQRLMAKQNAQRDGHKIAYTIKSGDSMWDLSRKYRVGMRTLAKWNNMAPTDPLRIGQTLVIWSEQPVKLASLSSGNNKTKKINYKVRQGDSLARIADKFNVSLNSVKDWNRKTGKKKYLQPGDFLTLYVDITQQY